MTIGADPYAILVLLYARLSHYYVCGEYKNRRNVMLSVRNDLTPYKMFHDRASNYLKIASTNVFKRRQHVRLVSILANENGVTVGSSPLKTLNH